MLPVQDFNGRLASLQFIDPDGRKILLKGGAKRDCFIPVEPGLSLTAPKCVLICEGWATGATLAENEIGATVLAAIDCGNLARVTRSARLCLPHAEIVVAGDDDRMTRGNPGRAAALAAAQGAGARLAFPRWPAGCPEALTDFNDLDGWLRARRAAA